MIYQNLGADFRAPKSGYRSQKGRVFSLKLLAPTNDEFKFKLKSEQMVTDKESQSFYLYLRVLSDNHQLSKENYGGTQNHHRATDLIYFKRGKEVILLVSLHLNTCSTLQIKTVA